MRPHVIAHIAQLRELLAARRAAEDLVEAPRLIVPELNLVEAFALHNSLAFRVPLGSEPLPPAAHRL